MKAAVLASAEQWNALTNNTAGIQWVKATLPFSFAEYKNADAFFILQTVDAIDYSQTARPVFLNSVTATLKEMNTPVNVLRINGWNTFLQRQLWEVAGAMTDEGKSVIQKINRNFVTTADEPGLIAARIIAMIINEAFFALGDKVSDMDAIDTAMKLGTNYPYGPFEWSAKIGLPHIYELLKKLSTTDKRYLPAPALEKEIYLTPQ